MNLDRSLGPRVAIVTDSAADIPPELVAKYGIRVAPQILHMGNNTWRDQVDIDSATFYKLLQSSTDFPSTSQPSAKSFIGLFAELGGNRQGIAAILVSNELSGTVNSALTAANSLPDNPIQIIDSRSASMGQGFAVLAAVRAAQEGKDLTAVADAARATMARTHVYFVVDTLEYLYRGGRIGAAAKLVGSALNMKPVLEIQNGIVSPLTRVRTRRKAMDKLFELVENQLRDKSDIHMAVLQVAAPEEAAQLALELEKRFRPVELINSECSPVIGAHAGPGTVGVAFFGHQSRATQ
jgi:DegV family protein with EDD domain